MRREGLTLLLPLLLAGCALGGDESTSNEGGDAICSVPIALEGSQEGDGVLFRVVGLSGGPYDPLGLTWQAARGEGEARIATTGRVGEGGVSYRDDDGSGGLSIGDAFLAPAGTAELSLFDAGGNFVGGNLACQ